MPRPSRSIARLSALLAALTLPAAAAQAQGYSEGRELVQGICGECHKAEGSGFPGDPLALEEVGRRRSWTGGETKAWLATNHQPKLPDLRLTGQEIYALERYLDALGAGRATGSFFD